MSILVTITGPIAAGKNTTADHLAARCTRSGRTVVVADLDDVADMVGPPGAGAAGLWFAAHRAHGALVGAWMRTDVDVVIAVGPVYTEAEQGALFGALPTDCRICRVLVDAPMSVTWERVTVDGRRGMSGQRGFHEAAHERFRSLVTGIPADLVFDSSAMEASAIASVIFDAIVSDRT